jgi:hypothetical protein
VRNLNFADQSLEVHLELTVGPVQGEGKPSHTDVMLIGNGIAVAVEAKWTEPPYSTVCEWIGKGRNQKNRRAVMSGWLSLLQPHAARELRLDTFLDATYQMVHRAASACAAGRRPSLAYLQFSPLPNGIEPNITQLQTKLSHLYDILGAPSAFPFFLIEVKLKATDAFHRISGLPKGSPKTAAMVRAVLLHAPLFEFTSVHPIQISHRP